MTTSGWILTSSAMVAMVAVLTMSVQNPELLPTWLVVDFGTTDPTLLSQSFLIVILFTVMAIRLWQHQQAKAIIDDKDTDAPAPPKFVKPRAVLQLQRKFLSVFWLVRVAFWMAGPYFYAAFASKTLPNGEPMPVRIISQVSLMGYAAIAFLGPMMGRITHTYGKKVGTIVGMLFYGLGSFSVTLDSIPLLFLGRALAGMGQSLLSNAPESWFVSEDKHPDLDPTGKYLGETFGIAYSFDSVVAILAGQIAELAAKQTGPTGPFLYSPAFLVLGSLVVLVLWSESRTTTISSSMSNTSLSNGDGHSIPDSIRVIFSDPRILCLGIVQSFFEASMYIFVIAWAPMMKETILKTFGQGVGTPYGLIFSCFMAACMLGSTLFGIAIKIVRLERAVAMVMVTASLSLAMSLWVTDSTHGGRFAVFQLFLSYLGFETCVGMYFPSTGTLRGSILPDSHRSVIMTLFAVPLNTMVAIVFLLLDRLGHRGGVAIATVAVGLAAVVMIMLEYMQSKRKEQTRARFKTIVHKASLLTAAASEFSHVGGSGQLHTVRGNFDRRASKSSFSSVNFPTI